MLDEEPLETRTTASKDQPEHPPCRRCGRPIEGRRRNGYCSDRCRMQDHRQRQAERVNDYLDTIERTVVALRTELEGGHETS